MSEPRCWKKRQALGLTVGRSNCDKCGPLIRPGWQCLEEAEAAAQPGADAPALLRIPTVHRSTADLLAIAGKLGLSHAVLIGQLEGDRVAFLTTDLSRAEANFMVDQAKMILLGPAPEIQR